MCLWERGEKEGRVGEEDCRTGADSWGAGK